MGRKGALLNGNMDKALRMCRGIERIASMERFSGGEIRRINPCGVVQMYKDKNKDKGK